MKKVVHKALVTVAAVIAAVLVLSGVGVAMFKGTPAFYSTDARPQQTEAERQQLARAAENKMIEAQNWAAALRADTQRGTRAAAKAPTALATTGPTTAGAAAAAAAPAAPPRAAASHVIEFSDDEINALFDKWSTLHGWRDQYADYLADPRVVLQDDRLILAGRMRELGAIASFQFRPRFDQGSGKLRLDLVRVTGGMLPLPEGVWGKWRDQIVESTRDHMPAWRAQARIDASGAANFEAMAATFSRLLFAVAAKEPAEPVLFLPLAGERGTVPVKVANVAVDTGKLTLTVEPMSPAERMALLERIRAPHGGDQAQAAGQ